MAFSVNHKEADRSILPEGEYEVIIQDARTETTKNGTPCVGLRLVVRNDCGQPYQNYTIFDNLYKRREPSPADLAVDGYSAKQVQALSKAAGLPDGKRYDSVDEWAEDLTGKLLCVTIRHESYNGQTKVRVQWRNATKRPDCRHIWEQGVPDAPQEGFSELPGGDGYAPF